MSEEKLANKSESKFSDHFVITVGDFISQNYQEKIKNGECVVGRIIAEEPQRNDFDSDKEYRNALSLFDLFLERSPTGNFEKIDEVNQKDDYYELRSIDQASGGVGVTPANSETKLLVFPKRQKILLKSG